MRSFLSSILFCLLILLVSTSAASGDAEGMRLLREGKEALDTGSAEEAIKKLTEARDKLPLLEDYAFLLLSEAFHKTADHKKSLTVIRELLAGYPMSPLRKKARQAELREARETASEDVEALYSSYLKDYPEEDDIGLIHADMLKKAGEPEKAKKIYLDIFVRAGGLCETAEARLSDGDISPDVLFERAANLMKRYEFKEAEQELWKAVTLENGKRKNEFLRSLGDALFKQKHYAEAAAIYDGAGDAYSKARSIYRSGDREGFLAAIAELQARGDRRTGSLLLALAADKRRERDFEGALSIYNSLIDGYPSEKEDALWGAGWTLYMSGEFRRAAGAFSTLSEKFEDAKYLYWQARSLESAGDDAKDIYRRLAKTGNNFYAALSSMKDKDAALPASIEAPAVPSGRYHGAERVEALLSLGWIKEAIAELSWSARKAEGLSEIFSVAAKLQALGEFRRSIGLVSRLPYSESLSRLWYPLAFWNEVEKISTAYGLDPFITISVMREESRFDSEARSVAGARGLMQIMPQTAYRLSKSLDLGVDSESEIHDVRNNISLGAYYLKTLSDEFGSLAHALAAYNAGEAAVRRWDQQGLYRSVDEFIEDIPYAETRNYVKKVITSYFNYKRSSGNGRPGEGVEVILGKL